MPRPPGRDQRTHLFCSRSFACLSRETSGRRLCSLLVRLQMWLRSSWSLCLLACSSPFSFLISCSSLWSRWRSQCKCTRNSLTFFHSPLHFCKHMNFELNQCIKEWNNINILQHLLGVWVRRTWGDVWRAPFSRVSYCVDGFGGFLPLLPFAVRDIHWTSMHFRQGALGGSLSFAALILLKEVFSHF